MRGKDKNKDFLSLTKNKDWPHFELLGAALLGEIPAHECPQQVSCSLKVVLVMMMIMVMVMAIVMNTLVPSRCCIIIIIHRPHEYDHLEKTPSLCLPYVADDSLLCKLGSGVCPSLKHLDVQVASNIMTLMLVMMTMIIIT